MKILLTIIMILAFSSVAFALEDEILWLLLRRAKEVRYSMMGNEMLTTMDGQRIMTMKGN